MFKIAKTKTKEEPTNKMEKPRPNHVRSHPNTPCTRRLSMELQGIFKYDGVLSHDKSTNTLRLLLHVVHPKDENKKDEQCGMV